MYRVEYFCHREGPFWQDYKTGLVFKTPAVYQDFRIARTVCDSLVWQYHSARVIDSAGNVVYQI